MKRFPYKLVMLVLSGFMALQIALSPSQAIADSGEWQFQLAPLRLAGRSKGNCGKPCRAFPPWTLM